jgi:hypothetical protein
MHLNKKIVTLTLLTFLTLTLTGCLNQGEVEPDYVSQNFSHSYSGITFDYPDSWSIQDLSEPNNVYIVGTNDIETSNITFSILPEATQESLDLIDSVFASQMQNSMTEPSMVTIEDGVRDINGLEFRAVGFNFTEGEFITQLTFLYYFNQASNEIYIILYVIENFITQSTPPMQIPLTQEQLAINDGSIPEINFIINSFKII